MAKIPHSFNPFPLANFIFNQSLTDYRGRTYTYYRGRTYTDFHGVTCTHFRGPTYTDFRGAASLHTWRTRRKGLRNTSRSKDLFFLLYNQQLIIITFILVHFYGLTYF